MELTFLLAVLVVAFLYSSVGHGGASGYLALMALFSIEPSLMRSSALLLNLFVSSLAFMAFYKGGHFKLKILLPFAITSIPMSFIGAQIGLNPATYRVVLGICLLFAIARMLFIHERPGEQNRPLPFILAMFIGMVLGFVSGMIGIGGGIILSPVLLLFNWASMKQTAAVAALFILLNSAAGLAGLGFQQASFSSEMWMMVAMAIGGGLAGSFAGSFKFRHLSLKYLLATVLLMASIKLLMV